MLYDHCAQSYSVFYYDGSSLKGSVMSTSTGKTALLMRTKQVGIRGSWKWHITIFKKECTTYKNVLSLAEHEAVKYLSITICRGLFWLPPFYWKMWKNGNARLVALTRTRHRPAQWRQVFPSHSCSLCSTPLSWNEQRHTRQSKSQSHNEGTLALFYDNCTHFLWICQSVKSDLRCIAYQLTYCGTPLLWNTLHRESEAIDEQKVVKWQGGVLNFWFGPY